MMHSDLREKDSFLTCCSQLGGWRLEQPGSTSWHSRRPEGQAGLKSWPKKPAVPSVLCKTQRWLCSSHLAPERLKQKRKPHSASSIPHSLPLHHRFQGGEEQTPLHQYRPLVPGYIGSSSPSPFSPMSSETEGKRKIVAQIRPRCQRTSIYGLDKVPRNICSPNLLGQLGKANVNQPHQ